MSGKTLFSLISLGLVYVYTTLNSPPVPVPSTPDNPLSSTIGLTKPNIGLSTVALISLPLETLVEDPIAVSYTHLTLPTKRIV